jgi:hypothetical protein
MQHYIAVDNTVHLSWSDDSAVVQLGSIFDHAEERQRSTSATYMNLSITAMSSFKTVVIFLFDSIST